MDMNRISSWQQVDMHHFHAMSLVAWLAGKQYMRTFYKELTIESIR